jgi:hypothetical protein
VLGHGKKFEAMSEEVNTYVAAPALDEQPDPPQVNHNAFAAPLDEPSSPPQSSPERPEPPRENPKQMEVSPNEEVGVKLLAKKNTLEKPVDDEEDERLRVASNQSTGKGPLFELEEQIEMKKQVRASIAKDEPYNVVDFYTDTGFYPFVAAHPVFENVTLGVIAFNALWMGIDTDLNESLSLLNAHPVFQIAEQCFCIYFSFELFIRFMSFETKLPQLPWRKDTEIQYSTDWSYNLERKTKTGVFKKCKDRNGQQLNMVFQPGKKNRNLHERGKNSRARAISADTSGRRASSLVQGRVVYVRFCASHPYGYGDMDFHTDGGSWWWRKIPLGRERFHSTLVQVAPAFPFDANVALPSRVNDFGKRYGHCNEICRLRGGPALALPLRLCYSDNSTCGGNGEYL